MLTHEQASELMLTTGRRMTDEERAALGEYLRHYGAIERRRRDAADGRWPCHCYDHCEDDDDNVERRPDCRKRD